jgi:hypothetical protein
MKLLPVSTHPVGELLPPSETSHFITENDRLTVDTFGGRVHVKWDPQAALPP